MCLSAAEIEAVVRDLAPRLQGGKVVRIDQPDRYRLILHVVQATRRCWLLIVAHPRFSRLHLLTRRPKICKTSPPFCNVVRQHITGSPIRTLRCIPGDRVAILDLTARDALMREKHVRLVAELLGPASNLLLVDDADRILGALSTRESGERKIATGLRYEPLPSAGPPPEKALINRFATVSASPEDELALSRAVQNAYHDLESQEELQEKRGAMLAALRTRLKSLQGRLRKLRRDADQAQNADKLRRAGELLKIALPDLKRGMDRVALKDLFEPGEPETVIELDVKRTPEQNVESYFERYKKLKASVQHVERRLRRTGEQVEALSALEKEIEAASNLEALDALAVRLRGEGLAVGEEEKPPAVAPVRAGPRTFTSSDGFEILIGRNQRQNHELTFSTARGSDIWMHLLGWEGPHVIVRKPRDKDVPLQTLLDAAHLMVYYSKIRGTDYAEVIYTQRKHVRPVKGGAPGLVNYANVSRLAVRFEKERVAKLLAPSDEEDDNT